MNIKRVSSSVLAAVVLLTSTISFASENEIEKIKDIAVDVEPTEQEIAIEMEKEKNQKIKELNKEVSKNNKKISNLSRTSDFIMGEVANILIGRYDGYSTNINLESDGQLTVTIKKPTELENTTKYMLIGIYDLDGNRIDSRFLYSDVWKGQSNFVYKTGLKAGKYRVTIDSSYEGDLETKLKLKFKNQANTEIEHNDSKEIANTIKLDEIYVGSTGESDYDTYKIRVSKDTNVKIYIKETQTINKVEDDDTRMFVNLANNGYESATANYEGVISKDITLKKGDNYINVASHAGLSDYKLKVSKITGPMAPEVWEIGDSDNYVSGSTQIGNRVYIKVGNGSYKQANVSEKGYFTLKTGKIKEGTVVRVFAKNSKGESSSVVKTKSIDRTPPVDPTINVFTVKSNTVVGKTEANARVLCRIGGKNGLVYETTANSKGKFSITVGKLKRGTKIEVQAVDANSNYSYITTSAVVNYVVAPTVDNLSNTSTKVTGKATKGNTVYVKAGKKYYKGTVNSSGKFSIKIPAQEYKSTIKVYAKDSSGDNSEVVSKTIGYAPKKPVVNAVTTKSTTITGTTTKNSIVAASIGGKTYTTTANAKGKFSIKIPKQKKGTKITLKAKIEKTGFKSYATTVTVK